MLLVSVDKSRIVKLRTPYSPAKLLKSAKWWRPYFATGKAIANQLLMSLIRR